MTSAADYMLVLFTSLLQLTTVIYQPAKDNAVMSSPFLINVINF